MSAARAKKELALERSLALVVEAIDLMDAYGGPPDAVAHLCLAREIVRAQVQKTKR